MPWGKIYLDDETKHFSKWELTILDLFFKIPLLGYGQSLENRACELGKVKASTKLITIFVVQKI